MNIVTRNKTDKSFYLVGVMKSTNDSWLTRGLCLNQDGTLRIQGFSQSFSSLKDAKIKANDLVKIKCKKGGYEKVDLSELPEIAYKYIMIPLGMWISPDEMKNQIKLAMIERYVTLCDFVGLEDRFDDGLEYIALETDDPEFLNIYDKEGKMVTCHISRISSIRPTELAEIVGVRSNK